MGPREAGSGRVRPSRAEWGRLGLSGVGRGWACIGIQLNYSIRLGPGYRIGQVGPREAGSGRVGQVRAEWGWGGVGHALGFK